MLTILLCPAPSSTEEIAFCSTTTSFWASFFSLSQLVATDKNFQAIYDAILIQLVLFIFYVLLRNSVKAGRCVLFCSLLCFDWCLLWNRLHFDITLFYNGLGSCRALVALEIYLLASFLLVYPLFKVSKGS